MTKKEKAIYLFKRYGYFAVLGLCAIILIIAIAVNSGKAKPVSNQNTVNVSSGSVSM